MTVLAAGFIESHSLREGKRRATEADSSVTPRAKRTDTHSCIRERATAQHKHTQHVHSVSDTQHRERSTVCLVCHMSARLRVRSRLSKHNHLSPRPLSLGVNTV